MGWIVGVIGLAIAAICIIKLRQKQVLDVRERNKLEQDVQLLKHNKSTLQEDLNFCQKQVEKEQQRFKSIVDEDNKILAQKAQEVDEFYDKAKARRLEQLENEIIQQEVSSKKLLQKNLEIETDKYQKQTSLLEQAYQSAVEEYNTRSKQIVKDTEFQQERFNNLLAPLHQYEKAQQERLYYTIQVPEEYRNDIDYLLNVVSQKVNHPDIISKLVWAEYVKPYMDETIKRIGIKDEPGIYKITNIETGKCYIGKSTNVKKRLQDHFKSSVGIEAIASQVIHNAILKEGIWNWTIEVISYCEKEKLSELEKYYIDFFKSQEFGYNKKQGG